AHAENSQRRIDRGQTRPPADRQKSAFSHLEGTMARMSIDDQSSTVYHQRNALPSIWRKPRERLDLPDKKSIRNAGAWTPIANSCYPLTRPAFSSIAGRRSDFVRPIVPGSSVLQRRQSHVSIFPLVWSYPLSPPSQADPESALLDAPHLW